MGTRLDYMKISPDGVKALGGVYSYVKQCGLDETLVELIFLRTSGINGCAYCIDMHTRALLKMSVKTDKVALIPVWREARALFSDREQAALAWCESVTIVAQTHIPDPDFAAAAGVFSEKELVDLTIVVGLMNLFNRMAIAFRKTPEAVLAVGK